MSKWILVRTDTFKRLYKTKTDEQKHKTKEALELLASSDNPLRLGTKKKNLGFWAFDLSHDDRLAYSVDGKELHLLKVCSHKDVYGRD